MDQTYLQGTGTIAWFFLLLQEHRDTVRQQVGPAEARDFRRVEENCRA